MHRPSCFTPRALWRAVLSVAFFTRAAVAQTPALFLGDLARRPSGSFRFADEMAMQNWALDIYGRQDGWVEIDLEVIPRRPMALPWVYSDGLNGKIGAPVRSRGYFTPAQIRAATAFADSLLDRTMPQDEVAKRFSRGAPPFIDMPSGSSKPGSTLLLMIYMGVKRRRAGLPPSVPDTVSFGLAGCLGVSDVGASLGGAALMGRGVDRSAPDFREIVRALDAAADYAARHASTPKQLHADLIDADEAACEAKPQYDFPRPEYPSGANGQTGDTHIDAVVDTAGRVDASTMKVMISGGALFDSVAVSAARQWRFAPALLTTAVPVAQRVHIDVHFSPKAPAGADMDRVIEDASAHGAGIVVVARTRKG